MIYLDNAATGGEKPASVMNAVLAAMKACANPGRSGHARSVACAQHVLSCRELLSDLFGGYGFERVVFTKNCTEALNIALLGTLRKGDHVVTTCLEHNSVLRPLEHLRAARGIPYDVAPLTEGRLLPEAIAALVRPETRACCVTTASNVTGEAPDLHALRALLPERVLLIADGAQGAGHLPISMRETGIDALALAGHKGLFAIQGAGALLLSDRLDPDPVLFGGTGSESYDLGMPAFLPDRLESGTLSYPAICSLFEGALIIKARREEIAGKLLAATTAFVRALEGSPAYRVDSGPNACGIAAFSHAHLPSEQLAQLLSDRFRIAVRGGLHCAPLAHRALGTFPDGLVRASFSAAHGVQECEALLRALTQLSGVTSV